MTIRAIKNSIIFRFLDKVNSKGEFEKGTTNSGLYVRATVDDSAKAPRWVTVLGAGPECKWIKDGCQVLLPALRWTAASRLDGESYWKSDETQVAAMRTDENSDLIPLNSYVILTREEKHTTTKSGLVVVGNMDTNTPRGKVVGLGPDCATELNNTTVLFNDMSVYEDFTHKNEKLTFIKQDDVIAYIEE